MCGIAGFLRWAGVEGDGGVTALVDRLRHRGPDDHGVWRSPDGACVLGHVRLSIIDLSAAGHQPMIDPLTGNAIVFNGEIYNFQELRAECERRGDRFVSRSDTEVILALYRRFSAKCLDHLRGMFALAIWDQEARQLFLARDRVGKKPLHYALVDGGVVFASEIDPLARHPAVSRAVDAEGLALYLGLQYIPAPWTIYRAIRKVPPAHCALVDRSGLRLAPYWDVDYRPKRAWREEEAVEALDEKVREAVGLRMVADVPVGALLSGGVDSSLVVATMARSTDQPIRTFSVGFADAKYNELPYAARVAERYATRHHPEIVAPDVEEILPTMARHYGEPFADSSAVPSFYVCRSARRHVTVALVGDGGDELLGGYPWHWLSASTERLGRALGNLAPPDWLAHVAGWLPEARTLPARALRKALVRAWQPEIVSTTVYGHFWSDRARQSLLRPEWGVPSGRVLRAWRREWLAESRQHAGNPVDRMLWIDSHAYLPGDLLVKMDIASMHCGLEVRAPFLDHELIEFCARLPAHLKVRRGAGKYLLKRLGERSLPPELLYRPKMGFAIPLARWLRGSLSAGLRRLVGERALTEWLDARVVEDHVARFLAGDDGEASRMWSLLMLAAWKDACHAR